METKHIHMFESWRDSLHEDYIPDENEKEAIEKGVKVLEKLKSMDLKEVAQFDPEGTVYRGSLYYAGPCDKKFRSDSPARGNLVTAGSNKIQKTYHDIAADLGMVDRKIDWKEALDIVIKLFKEDKSCIDDSRSESDPDDGYSRHFYWLNLVSWRDNDDGVIQVRIEPNGEVSIEYCTEFSDGSAHNPTSNPQELLKQLAATAGWMKRDLEE